jgi:predicted RNA binding protein YcfA (HicA-like mRNA interferase family)
MSQADKLLEKMKNSKAGWSADDLHTLYVGFGFEFREGGKHVIYIHPKYTELRATVARHGSLAIGYIQHAISLIEKLKDLEKEAGFDEYVS